jgi:4-amino-4-deoxy-L-arabinose transferase-like glycosyltransferase
VLKAVRTHINNIDRFFGVVYRLLMYKNLGILFYLIGLLFILANTTLFDRVLREDAFHYIHKGMEITNGDFGLLRYQAIGWPLLLSIVYKILGVKELFVAMYVARWVSILCICLSVIPISIICKKVTGDKYSDGVCIIVLTAFCLSPLIYFAGRHAMTEPLFLLLALLCIVFMVEEKTAVKNIIFASFFASLAYYVKPNGIFLLGVILITLFIRGDSGKKALLQNITIALIVFILISLPHLVARYIEFGSPFDYGANSKYFVDSYKEVWADNIPNPSIIEYLRSHNFHDYYNKFIDKGLLHVLNNIFSNSFVISIWRYLFVMSIIICLVIKKNQRYYPLFVLIIVSIIGLSFVFHIFGNYRHLIYLIPFFLIFSSGALCELEFIKHVKFVNIALTFVLAVTIIYAPKIEFLTKNHIDIPVVKDTWAVWAARNITGNVAIVEGGDLLVMSQYYKSDSEKKIQRKFSEVKQLIKPMRPGLYETMDQAIKDFKRMGINYVITDKCNLRRRPYLNEIKKDKWKNIFQHMNYFVHGDKGATLFGVNIYKINYQ